MFALKCTGLKISFELRMIVIMIVGFAYLKVLEVMMEFLRMRKMIVSGKIELTTDFQGRFENELVSMIVNSLMVS
jgi:hypothetical protein